MSVRRKLSSEEWSILLEEFNSSELSQSKFAEQNNIVKSQLSYYIAKSREGKSGEKEPFIDLPSVKSTPAQGVVAELEFPGGIIFRVRG